MDDPRAIEEDAQDWPRDFDSRAEGAEPQELFAPAGQPAAAPSQHRPPEQ